MLADKSCCRTEFEVSTPDHLVFFGCGSDQKALPAQTDPSLATLLTDSHSARAGRTKDDDCKAHTDLPCPSCVQGLLESVVGKSDFEESLTAILTWLRFSSARLLTWNRNYNVKPREISAAQARSSAAVWVPLQLASGRAR